MLPTFAHVGAAGGFANGVEIEGAHNALEVLVAFAAKEFDSEPVGARMRSWRGGPEMFGGSQRRLRVGDYGKGGSHSGVESLCYFLLWKRSNGLLRKRSNGLLRKRSNGRSLLNRCSRPPVFARRVQRSEEN